MEELKNRIIKFAHTKHSLYDGGYDDENWHSLKAESLKFTHKREYNSAINNLTYWFREHDVNVAHFRLTDIIVLGNDVFVYTQSPGTWIGKKAETLNEIEHRMNHKINGEKAHDYKLHIVEDKDSALLFFRTWFNQKYKN